MGYDTKIWVRDYVGISDPYKIHYDTITLFSPKYAKMRIK